MHLLLFTLFTCLSLHSAHAQYIQDYEWGQVNGVARRLWQPTTTSALREVIDLAPQAVVLEYNCFYLREICVSASSFQINFRGRSRPYPNIFGYDMDTSRKVRRREASCPSSRLSGWATTHQCPETGIPVQQLPMKQNGQWWFTAIDPILSTMVTNPILNLRNPPLTGNVIEPSNIRYSCDEFPPATWVEGGNSITLAGSALNNGDALTRCAAMSCARHTKAEQDWQGRAHNALRRELIRLARTAVTDGRIRRFDQGRDVVFFRLNQVREMNGVAARVLTYADPAFLQLDDTYSIDQQKRSERSGNYLQWLNDVSIEDLKASGNITVRHIYVNETLHEQEISKWPSFYTPSGRQQYDDDGDIDNIFKNVTTADRWPQAHQDDPKALNSIDQPLLRRDKDNDLEQAFIVVKDALAKTATQNAARYATPLAPGTSTGHGNSTTPVLTDITKKVADAAALITEAYARNVTSDIKKRATSDLYWMGQIARKGTVPWGDDPTYKVFRNVIDYGAKGDGITDDTRSIKQAMADGNRCGEKCNGSSTKNAIVYFPPGKYLVSSTIPMPFGTQVIGDGKDWPTIIASEVFVGLGVLSADEYTGGGTGTDGLDQEYYINTANFYRQVRNLRIDITRTRSEEQVSALHWQVGQATSLQNLELIAASGTQQRGIFTENGSGGVMSDITFRGGAFGIYGGDQQFTAQRLTFDGCKTGVQVIWDWGWVWKSVTMTNVDVGFRLLPESTTSAQKRQTAARPSGNIGSAAFLNSSFTNVNTVVLIAPPNSQPGSGSTGISMENIAFNGVSKGVADTNGQVLLAPVAKVDTWVLGPTYLPGRSWSNGGSNGVYRRQKGLLDSQGRYFERAKPQYEDHAVTDFLHVKDFGAKGDGTTDDTEAFQRALYASQGKILFVDAGSYILTDTVMVPSGTKIVGETWSQLVASGYKFYDVNNPKVMLKVGNQGEVGDVEMQDLIFTNRGPTIGLVMVEWNMQASTPGSAALWDCHVRVGGATGTQLTPTECPPSTSGVDNGCSAASLLMHITAGASGLFDNMWLWVADHMIDDPDLDDANNTMVQNSVYVARGLLIESQLPTWLYGTASEHSVLYQYNFNNARNIFAAIIQTESPYFQPNPQPPAPFQNAVGKFSGDPDYACAANDEFSGCDEAWAVIIQRSANIMIGGAGLYSWFSNYSQDCIDTQTCQKALLLLKNNDAGVRFRNLITIGAKYMAVEDGKEIAAVDNLNVNSHPHWSQITAIDFKGNGNAVDQEIWIDPKIWDMEQPQFTCSAPCVVQLPPWTKATSTVDYPLLTVSTGDWTSTITRAPLTVTEVFFELVTLTNEPGGKMHKRQGLTPFWPTPSPIPYYSPAVYMGPDGAMTTTTPAAKYPAPAASIGPDAARPPLGSWPEKQVMPLEGPESPLVPHCSFDDFGCRNPWIFGGMGSSPLEPGDGGDNENDGGPEDNTLCPIGLDVTTVSRQSSSSSSTTSSSTTSSTTSTVALAKPSPMANTVTCFESGRATNHARMDSAINSFCENLSRAGSSFKGPYTTPVYRSPFPVASLEIPLEIESRFTIFGNCEWDFTHDECVRYMEVAVNSCNCSGTGHKQGGFVKNNCVAFKIDPVSKY